MSAVLFDTHAFIKRLTAVGMPEAQAEVLADQQARLIDERLATKSDIAAVNSDIAAVKSDIATLATKAELRETELRLEAKIETTKADILKWMFGQTLVIIGVIMALLRFGH